jgi:predicted AlkP superfamily phosphohydrolase/phosphomutase
MASKVLVYGVDAMDPRIARTLMAKGTLPNFSKLNFSPLATTTPPETPVAWSAAATGSNPGRYGIYDFLKRDLKTYLPKLNLSEEKPGLVKTTYTCAMKGEPFWRTLTQENVPVTVLRWPVTFPAEKISGNMLAGLGVVDLRGSMNNYAYYSTDDSCLALEGAEKVTILEQDSQTYTTEIAGPMIRKRGELRKITVPLKITKNRDSADFEVGDQKFTLKVGEWSSILRLKFRVLPFLDMYGICNMYLSSVEPHFSLYISSMQVDPENQAVDITAPASYGKELAEKVGLFYTLGMAEDTKAVTEGKLSSAAFFEQVKQIEAEREAMFRYEFSRFEQGVLAVVFDAGDRLNHIFWQNHDDINQVGDEVTIPPEIEWYYKGKDALLGEVLEAIDDDTTLLVVSDHGFSDFKRQVNLNAWLVKEGFMKASREGKPELFGQVEWSESSAYSLGFTSLFLNLEAREGQGVVPASDRKGVLDEISSKLLRLKDGGKDVVTAVYRGDEVYAGSEAEHAPDLVIGFAPGYRMSWKSAVGSHDEDIISDNTAEWSGDHLIDPSHVPGVVFSNRKITKDSPSLLDIAPTVLTAMGLKPGAHIDGESLL